jgi:hypothetical protein
MFAMVAGVFGLILFLVYLINFSLSSRSDDLRCPSEGSEYTTRHRVTRKLAGTVVIRRD